MVQGQDHTPTASMVQDFYEAQIKSTFLLVFTPVFRVLPCSLLACYGLTKKNSKNSPQKSMSLTLTTPKK